MLSTEFLIYFQDFPFIKYNYLGAFSLDQFPNEIPENKFAIINTAESSSIGQHWFLVFKSSENYIELFDSLVVKLDIVVKILRNHFKNFQKYTLVYNSIALQQKNSITCGHFVVYFIINRFYNRDLTFYEFVNEYFSENCEKNEQTITDFCKKIRSDQNDREL